MTEINSQAWKCSCQSMFLDVFRVSMDEQLLKLAYLFLVQFLSDSFLLCDLNFDPESFTMTY